MSTSNYQLLASYYNTHTKKYDHEIVVKLENTPLSNLIDIDRFTSQYTKDEILKHLEENYNCFFNNLVIRYTRKKESSAIYYKVIYHNVEYFQFLSKTYTKNCYLLGRPVTHTFVDTSSPFYQKNLAIIKDILENGTYNQFIEKYPYSANNTLIEAARRYYTSSHDNESDRNIAMEEVLKIFSIHKYFRGFIIASLYPKEKKISSPPNSSFKEEPSTPLENIPTISENEQLFEQMFYQTHQSTYEDYRRMLYNRENEEYLTTEEVAMLYGEDTLAEPISTKTRKRTYPKKKQLSSHHEENY